jgi:hypothetical protein
MKLRKRLKRKVKYYSTQKTRRLIINLKAATVILMKEVLVHKFQKDWGLDVVEPNEAQAAELREFMDSIKDVIMDGIKK